jgi:DNA-binding Lrp family transcriptional regulator
LGGIAVSDSREANGAVVTAYYSLFILYISIYCFILTIVQYNILELKLIMNNAQNLDSTDRAILNILQQDGALPNATLANKVKLSPSPCLSRTRRLREEGIIQQTVAIVDERKVGLETVAFTFITLSPHNRQMAEAFVERTKNTSWILAEGGVKHILLTGGCFSAEREINLVSDIIAAIHEGIGLDRVPGTILPSPAKGDDIQRYYDTGIQAIGFSMEIWNDRLYQAICPGKSEATSHADFMRSIQHAVKVFGEGNVYAVFVMGLEPRESLLDGFRWLADTGANVVPFVWSPNPGSQLSGHRAPTAAWFADVVREGAEIFAASNIPSGVENHCYRCDGNNLLHDALRAKGIE